MNNKNVTGNEDTSTPSDDKPIDGVTGDENDDIPTDNNRTDDENNFTPIDGTDVPIGDLDGNDENISTPAGGDDQTDNVVVDEDSTASGDDNQTDGAADSENISAFSVGKPNEEKKEDKKDTPTTGDDVKKDTSTTDNYEYYSITLNTGDALYAAGTTGDHTWLVQGTYDSEFTFGEDNVLTVTIGNQSATLPVTIPEGYTVGDYELVVVWSDSSINSQESVYDCAIVTINIKTVIDDDGNEVPYEPEGGRRERRGKAYS